MEELTRNSDHFEDDSMLDKMVALVNAYNPSSEPMPQKKVAARKLKIHVFQGGNESQQ